MEREEGKRGGRDGKRRTGRANPLNINPGHGCVENM